MALVLLQGCARSAADPFAAPAPGAEGGGVHRVRFQVSCNACSVSWSLGPRSGGARGSEALWSETVRLRVSEGETVRARLLASPTEGRVSWVRIRLDGEVVAEARSEEAGAGGVLTVETVIP